MWLSLTCVRVLCEPKPLWPACISVIDQAKVEDLAGAAEQLTYLLFRQSWAEMWSAVPRCVLESTDGGLTIGDVAHKDNPARGLGRHFEEELKSDFFAGARIS